MIASDVASDAPCRQRRRQRRRQRGSQRLARRLIQGSTTRSWCATRSLTGTTLPSCVTLSVLIIWSAGFALALTGNPLSSSLLSFSLLLLPSPSLLIYSMKIVLLGGVRRRARLRSNASDHRKCIIPLLPPSLSSLFPLVFYIYFTVIFYLIMSRLGESQARSAVCGSLT